MRMFTTALVIVTSCGITALAQEPAKKVSDFELCHTTYALCTFSQCGQATGSGKQKTTTCSCSVWQGYSVAAYSTSGTECDGPTKNPAGQTIVVSRYYPIPGYATCSNTKPWAMCLDKQCTVDDKDKTK